MKKIAIITDSDASLPEGLVEKFGIYIVPIGIQFGEESYITGETINDEMLFKLIDEKRKLPTTSAPSPNAFKNIFEKALKDGAEQILCICVSSQISATYQAALSALEFFPGKDITVIDSYNLSMGQGFIVLEAAKGAAQGKTKEQILADIENIKPLIHVYGALPTLKYLAMGGRMGKLQAGVADTLDIKPILTSRDGKLDLLEKVRTLRKAEERLVDLAIACVEGKEVREIALIHVNNLAGVKGLFKKLQEKIVFKSEPIYADFTPGLSVHAGAGVLGFVIVTN
jgi:DegV family protein with EDD domain